MVSVGADVKHVQPGDRVLAAASQVRTGELDHGAFQNYTVVKAITTAKLPEGTDLAEAAALVTGSSAAAHTLVDVFGFERAAFEKQALPPLPATGPSLVVWGGASNVGIMTIQLARLAGLRIFAAASARHHEYLRSLGVEVLVDYHSPSAVQDLAAAATAAGAPFAYVADAISTPATLKSCLEVLAHASGAPGAPAVKLCHTLPWPQDLAVPEGVVHTWVRGSDVWSRTKDLAVWLFHHALPAWLEHGVVKASPIRVIEGGIAAVQNALNEVKQGPSGEKIMVAI